MRIKLPFKIRKPVLALGSQTKNTLCFARGNTAVIGRIRPDLSNPKDFLAFERDVKYFLKKKPRIIACDLHPEYQSTKHAHSLQLKAYSLKLIQHHHAHIASCMAENALKNQKVIGVAFDGTGLGSDGKLWGAEFLLCDYNNFQRKAHLREIPLLGGEKAIAEPWRLTAAWMFLAGKEKKIRHKQWKILKQAYSAGINSPFSSSMGRLFDAVGSLVLKKDKAAFEAELAIELEKISERYTLSLPAARLPARQRQAGAKRYNFSIKKSDTHIIDPVPMFKDILRDLQRKINPDEVAFRFHLTVAEMVKKTCLLLRRQLNINRVVLSGGVFQNQLLSRLALDLLQAEDFVVFKHKDLSSGDSSLALGQAVIAGMGG